MARIDVAYSLELGKVVDAYQANELWMEGFLSDKWAFECTGRNCDARITCKNMDTMASDRKRCPHFIFSSRSNMHAPDCEVYAQYSEQNEKPAKETGHHRMQGTCKRITFHVERPENHEMIQHSKNKSENDNDPKRKSRALQNYENNKGGAANYYMINSLIGNYAKAYEDGRLDKERIIIDFGRGRKYNYSYREAFKRISECDENDGTDKYHYVYFGRAVIRKSKGDGYSIFFKEQFKNSAKSVISVIPAKMLNRYRYGKRLSMINKYIGKEAYVYLLASKNTTDKTVYLNAINIDCVGISEKLLDTDSTMDEGY